MQKFLESTREPKVIYIDNSLEFGKACEDLSWNHCASTPDSSEMNRVAERAVRRLKEGTSALLLQFGLDEKWWADSMECYCYLRNIQDCLSDGRTPHERRFGEPFKEFYLARCLNITTCLQKTDRDSTSLGRKCCPEYLSDTCCTWGDIRVADIEQLEKDGRIRNPR